MEVSLDNTSLLSVNFEIGYMVSKDRKGFSQRMIYQKSTEVCPRHILILKLPNMPLVKNELIPHWRLSLLAKMLKFGLIGTVRPLHAVRQWGFPGLNFRWTDTCDISKLNFQLCTHCPLQLPTVSPDNCLTAPTNDEGLS